MTGEQPADRILHDLQERAKELNCLYRVDELLSRSELSVEAVLRAVLAVIPPGWQHPDGCAARIQLGERTYEPTGFQASPWSMEAPIPAQGEAAGKVEVFYTEAMPRADEGPFLKEEFRLLKTIGERIGQMLERRKFLSAMSAESPQGASWWVVLDFLHRTDRALLARLGRKMINHLCWNDVEEAKALLLRTVGPRGGTAEENEPSARPSAAAPEIVDEAFRIAGKHLPESEIVASIQSWIKEDRTTFLKDALERLDTSLIELADALQRFRHAGVEERELSVATQMGLKAALVRRFLTDQLGFVNTAKSILEVADFDELSQRIVYPPRSHGRLGGKAAGLFLASRIVARSKEYADVLGDIRTPRSWYIPSDGILDFIHHNDLDDVYNRKYMDTDRVRQEYPHIVHVFKSSGFPPEVLRGLGVVLDDLEGKPVIVRSSSLLEDRLGAAFSGKYKSLFLANTGTKRERLEALTDAIAEVYASVFGPDPIEYRARRGFLDMHEEMGILIQEVVGSRVGPYFLPAFAGVAFSNNEFRWSARIKREDGLLRMVPGLGTRAVDRLADDYPVLIAPGQPGLRVTQTSEEARHYAPRKADVINLATGRFETVEMSRLLREHGNELPLARQLLSIAGDGLRRPVGLIDFESKDLVVTFEGLVSETPFVARIRALLALLAEKLGTPVDIEFASDGTSLTLLQCRPQGATEGAQPAPIPRDIPPDRLLFSANRHVSNGQVGEITHVVYVDPDAYAQLPLSELPEVGRAVGRLNRLLPKRQFVLMGPGRWGSRGDVRLGVPVTYADISNTAVLVEIARARGGYVPDLSFGTHFFQDLVESAIRYLPLYPDDPAVAFNEPFFRRSPNALTRLMPELERLSDVIRVIDVPNATGGLVLNVLMNAELDEAVGVLTRPSAVSAGTRAGESVAADAEARPDTHWRFRMAMAQRIAARLDAKRYGIKAVYVIGSAKNATSGPASDLDLLIHDSGDPAIRGELDSWLQGWSLALAEVNYLRTGYKTSGLLDVHYVTDEDIANRTSFAVKIGAITDAARALPLGAEANRGEGSTPR